MSSMPGRFSQLRWVHNAICAAAIIGALVMIALGMGSNPILAGSGALLLFGALIMMTLMPLLIKIEATTSRQLSELRDLQDRIAQEGALLAQIAESTRISDAAKSLAHRDQELDALRAVIREDVRRHKWDAALSLIDEMDERFGYKQEAESLREEVDDARRGAMQAKLAQAVEIIERHFAAHEWSRAQREIDRLLHVLPGDAKIMQLHDRMKMLREQHKMDLRRSWDEAVRRSDTDHAIDVLRELDQYLSSEEATALQESARHVFKEKLLQVGVQFRFAVNEKRWKDALSIGLELVREFPNARMANEVREVLDTLRERARAAESGMEVVNS